MSDYFDHRKDSPVLRTATQAFSDAMLGEILPDLRLTARGLGYALAVHGTRARDIDLLAVPWTASAATPDELLDGVLGALSAKLGRCHVHKKKIGRNRVREWVTKPHGRRAILVFLPGMAPEIDFSVFSPEEKAA